MKRSEDIKELMPDPKRINLQELLSICQEFERSGSNHQALEILRSWLKLNPNSGSSFAGWYELGRLLQGQRHYKKAEAAFRAALDQKPTLFEARVALGKSLESQGRKQEAIETWLTALPSERLQIELLNNAARVQDDTSQLINIEGTLLRSLKLNPEQGDVLTTLLQVRQKLCRWPVISKDLPAPLKNQKDSIGPLMSLALLDNPRASYLAAQSFLAAKGFDALKGPAFKFTKQTSKKIHVGFISADIRLHATSVFFSPLLTDYDREKFTVSILDITTAQDAFPQFRENLIQSVDQHIPLQGLSDEEAVIKCREKKIDILIDLGGLTAGARPRIVAERIAPIQVGYIGFLSSTAIKNLDFIITTRDLFKSSQKSYSEKPLYLKGPYLTLDSKPEISNTISKKQLGISDDSFIYGALLNTYKINLEVFGAWMEILKKTKTTLIWLVEDNEIAKNNLIKISEEMGINSDRLIFSKRVHPSLYRNQLQLCDVFLDSFPYGSGATARDAIHAGLPMLTKPGKTMMSRLSTHMMNELGIGELVCRDVSEYVEKAIDLANNKSRVLDIKNKMELSKKKSDLFNQKKFVDQFYSAIKSKYELEIIK